MPEDNMTVQILSQTSESIAKLFDLSTRIDERVKAIQTKQHDLDVRLEGVIKSHQEMMQKIAVLESKDDDHLEDQVDQCKKDLFSLDKRLTAVEADSGRTQDRWNKIFTFVIQLVWVLLAAWLLLKLNLQAPAVP